MTGSSTVVIHTPEDPECIHVTGDGRILLGSDNPPSMVYEYELAGKLLQKSSEKFKIKGILQSPKTNNTAICYEGEIIILDPKLFRIHTFFGLIGAQRKPFYLPSALFDQYDNLIVGDCLNKEVYVLDGSSYNLIQTFGLDCMSHPAEIQLHKNVLWVRCDEPSTIISVELSE